MTTYSYKYIKDLVAGDIVKEYDAYFLIVKDAISSMSHRPEGPRGVVTQGPSDCAWADSKWVSGEVVKGYFGPDKNWLFQGNLNVRCRVIAA
jgi:hypothetical protein